MQLIIFYISASLEKAGYKSILDLIKDYCRRFLQPEAETPIGEILG